MLSPKPFVRTLALALPIAVALHVLEEAPRFVSWFNGLVKPAITQPLFLSVNAVALAITVIIAIVVAGAHEPVSGLIGAAWVGFLMLANAFFHIIATVALGRYCPGVVTATLFYLPLSFVFLRAIVRELSVPIPLVVAVALLAGAPMYIHGYLIVFHGSRLF